MTTAFVAESLGVRECCRSIYLFIIKKGARDLQRALHITQGSLLGYCMPLTTRDSAKAELEPGLPHKGACLLLGALCLLAVQPALKHPLILQVGVGALCLWVAMFVCT